MRQKKKEEVDSEAKEESAAANLRSTPAPSGKKATDVRIPSLKNDDDIVNASSPAPEKSYKVDQVLFLKDFPKTA